MSMIFLPTFEIIKSISFMISLEVQTKCIQYCIVFLFYSTAHVYNFFNHLLDFEGSQFEL